jgi:ribonucleoside-diphosphate reductase alpha chain
LQRDPVLSGLTYKVRWPRSEHALYITINDVEVDGRRRPFEIFINTKNLDHYAWTVALTRMMSAVFRRGGDVGFVVEELRAVFDPQGGAWMDGRYVPSLLAAIGDVIDTHLKHGYAPSATSEPVAVAAVVSPPEAATSSAPQEQPQKFASNRACPKCGRPTWQRIGGCWSCSTCQFSQCD